MTTTATITITTGNVTARKVVSRTQAPVDGLFDRRAARELARKNAETVKGQAVEVSTSDVTYRFSHSEVSK